MALGGEAGARLLPRLAMATSADTLLRLIRRQPLAATATPTALGVDDWSFKRGRTYGAILVDLESQRAVDLLPDRKAETLAAWLRPRRRHIQVVARDRSTEFARGVELSGWPGESPLLGLEQCRGRGVTNSSQNDVLAR